MNDKTKFPQFVRMGEGKGSCLRLKNGSNNDFEYFLDGGCWEVDFVFRGDELYSKSHMNSIHNQLLTPITEKEWRKGNGEYAPKNPEIYGYLIEDETKIINSDKNKLMYLLIKK